MALAPAKAAPAVLRVACAAMSAFLALAALLLSVCVFFFVARPAMLRVFAFLVFREVRVGPCGVIF